MRWMLHAVLMVAIVLPVFVHAQNCQQQNLKSPNGPGVLVDSGCNRYEGEFVNGRLNGRGKITRQTGDTEEGVFRDGYLSGNGVLNQADGTRQEGIFVSGSLRSGKSRDENGVISEGLFPYGRDLNGFGIRTWPDGTKLVGEFRDGRPAGSMHVAWPDSTVEKRTYSMSGGRSDKPVQGEAMPPVATPRPSTASQQPSGRQQQGDSAPSPSQVGDEINRAIRDLKSIFGR